VAWVIFGGGFQSDSFAVALQSAMAILAMLEHGQDARGTSVPPAIRRTAKREKVLERVKK
jgi:hypothetical protein